MHAHVSAACDCPALRRLLTRARMCAQVSVCPGGVPTGFTYFIPQEEHLESRVVTRAFMEAKMTVAMAGRCARHSVPPQLALKNTLWTLPCAVPQLPPDIALWALPCA
jgi:hypothetical protein